MKARVKATGEIIEISEGCLHLYAENYDKDYNLNELEFLDVKEKSLPKDESDYWEKLKHQYAGIILATTYSSTLFERNTKDEIYSNAILMASELIDKLKENERNKES